MADEPGTFGGGQFPPELTALAVTNQDSHTQPLESAPAAARDSRSDRPVTARVVAPLSLTTPAPHVWSEILVWVVLGAAVIGVLRRVILAIRTQRRLRRAAVVTSGSLRECLDALLRQRQVRLRVRLLICADIGEPAACGVWRPSILIPPGLGERLGREELTALLAHELAHLVRRDTVWLWIGGFLCGLAPWQPLNFLAMRRWRDEAEILCDAWAVHQGVARLTMARSLARVAEWRHGRLAGHRLTATGTRSGLAHRIEILASGNVATYRQKNWRAINALIVLVALLLCCSGPVLFGTAVQAEDAEASSSSRMPPVSAERSRPPSLPMADPGDGIPAHALQALLADLRRLDDLLAVDDDSPHFQSTRDSFRRRIAELETRLSGLTEVELFLDSPVPSAEVRSTTRTVREHTP